MIKIISNYFDDQNSPMLDVVLKFFKLMLFWAPARTKIQSVIYRMALIYTSGILLNQLINAIVRRKFEMFMSLIQYSTYHIGVVKVATYYIWREHWEIAIVELTNIEKFFEKDPKCNKVLKKYRRRGRALVFGFVTIAIIAKLAFDLNTCYSVIKEMVFDVPIPARSKIFHVWWPFIEDKMPGWIVDMIFQNIYAYIACLYVIAYDSLLLLILIVFAGHMQMVAVMFNHSLDSDTLVEQKKKLIKCHQMYIAILKLHKTCNSALSPPLFVHLLVVALSLAVSIYNMTSDTNMLVPALLFMGGQLLQLILYYWHGNEVTVQSSLVSYSLFESDWIDKGLDTKRLIALLSVSTRKLVYFSAGPFSRVSLSTFVSILRTSYSFYTLMKKAPK